jgi:hypothetical protein
VTTLTTADHELLIRLGRGQAEKAIRTAIAAVLDYAELVRQAIEHRDGLPAGDERALDDGTYDQILQVYVSLGDAKLRLSAVAEEIR